ncbi:MAG: DMT family transporter [Pseudomonadota bacterium]
MTADNQQTLAPRRSRSPDNPRKIEVPRITAVSTAQATTPASPGTLNWILVVALGAIWGAAFMSVSVALEGFGPVWLAALRVAIAAVVLAVIGHLMGQGLARVPRRAAPYVALLGVGAVALPFLLLSWGQQYVPSAFAGVAMGTVPLLVVPLVALFSPEEGIGPRRIAGMALGFLGIVTLFGPDAWSGHSETFGFWGQAACIVAAGCYAGGSVLTRRTPKTPPLALAAGSLVAASVILLPLALVVEGVPEAPSAKPTLALLYAALFPTAIAAVIRVRVITTAGSLFMSLTSYMVPVWAVIFGIALLGEDLPQSLFWGLGLILAGIALSQWSSVRAALRR